MTIQLYPRHHTSQWPFQEPKLEVPTIYKAYFLGLNFSEYPQKIWPKIYGRFTYLHLLDPEIPIATGFLYLHIYIHTLLILFHHILHISIQWPFQDPKLEVPTIYKAYVREYPHKIWPYTVQYLQFRILEFPYLNGNQNPPPGPLVRRPTCCCATGIP